MAAFEILRYDHGVAVLLIPNDDRPELTDELLVGLLKSYGVPPDALVHVNFAMWCPVCEWGSIANINHAHADLVMPGDASAESVLTEIASPS